MKQFKGVYPIGVTLGQAQYFGFVPFIISMFVEKA